MKYHPMDVVTRPNAKRTKVAEAEEDDSLPSTSEARTTRSKSVAVEKVKYDMSFHPLGEVLPKAPTARKTAKSISSSTSGSSSRRSDTSSVVNPANLFTQPIELDWLDLSDFDRRVYLLQQGSPIKGTAIPLKWSRVIRILISEEHLTRQQLKDWGGEEELKQRYERVRLQMVAFFGADKEPENRKGWKVYHMEGFEVYDLPSTYERETNGKGSKTRAEAMDEADMVSEDESDEDDNYPMDYQLHTEHTDRLSSARHRARLEDSSNELAGSMHEIRDEMIGSIDDAMMSEGEVTAEHEQHVRQKEAVDIVLSDRASTVSAVSPFSKDSSYSTDPGPTFKAPVAAVANMTEISTMQDRVSAVPVVSDETESAGGTAQPSSVHPVKTSTSLAVDGLTRGSNEPADVVQFLKALLPDTADSLDAASPQETVQVPPKTPVNTKRMKCAASSAATFTIHEDAEGTSPRVNKQVALHPISPSTDVPKENYGQTNQDEPDPPSQQSLNDWAVRDRPARTGEAVNVSRGAVHHAASEANPSSGHRRPVFQPLPLGTNFDVVIEARVASRATSLPTGASAGRSAVTTGMAAQHLIEGRARR